MAELLFTFHVCRAQGFVETSPGLHFCMILSGRRGPSRFVTATEATGTELLAGTAEIDPVLVRQGRMYGAECKRVDAPSFTPSMRISLHGQFPGDPVAHGHRSLAVSLRFGKIEAEGDDEIPIDRLL